MEIIEKKLIDKYGSVFEAWVELVNEESNGIILFPEGSAERNFLRSNKVKDEQNKYFRDNLDKWIQTPCTPTKIILRKDYAY